MGKVVVLWMVFTVAPSGTMTSPVSFTIRPDYPHQRFADAAACRAHAAEARLDTRWVEVVARQRSLTVSTQCLPEGASPSLPEGTRPLFESQQALDAAMTRAWAERALDATPRESEAAEKMRATRWAITDALRGAGVK